MKQSIKIPLLIVITFCFCFSNCLKGSQQTLKNKYKEVIAEIEHMISMEMEINSIQGLSIGIVDDQSIVWTQGFGMASESVKATAKTVYQVGSISKLFTAGMIMQLFDKGLVKLDTPVENYIPGLNIISRFNPEEKVTIRHLLMHHSGLPNYDLPDMFTFKKEVDFQSWLTRYMGSNLMYPPGYCFSYSNLGYNLLGSVITEVSQAAFKDLADKELFSPLDMKNSSFNVKNIKGKLLATGFAMEEARDPYIINTIPAAGAYSNVTDLCRFIKMINANGISNEKQILSPTAIKMMIEPQNKGLPFAYDFKIGLGWFIDCNLSIIIGGYDSQNVHYIGHDGNTILHNGSIKIAPDDRIGVVVLTNTTTGIRSYEKIAMKALERSVHTKRGIKLKPDKEQEIKPLKIFDRQKYRNFLGLYQTKHFGVIPVIMQEGKLITRLFGLDMDLVCHTDNSFSIQIDGEVFGLFKNRYLDFDKVDDQTLLIINMPNNKRFAFGKKINNLNRITPEWIKRVGKYTIVNNDDDIVFYDDFYLDYRDGYLTFTFGTHTLGGHQSSSFTWEYIINPLDDQQAVILELGSDNMGEVITVENSDGTEYLIYSGWKLQKRKKLEKD